ncbi:MAG TPA: galactonate dehydratase [Chthoniobacteraceae bacterium]|jgi:galactonate dehydratase|nr:galactonate dehydratase [Chthoniobacteraceae bacterium]
MKIRSLETFLIAPRWCFLKLTTESGLVGWGEPVVEGKAATVAAAVEEMADFVIGHDATRIEDLWQVLYRGGFYRGGPVLMSAMSGIDQALWDIKGKALGVPVYELLGGAVREKIRVYAWIGGDRPGDVAAEAKAKQQQGYTAIKMNGTEETEWIGSPARLREAVARAEAIREACGPDFGIAIDFHGRVHKGSAKALMKELEPVKPLFIEEPVLAENNEALLDLRSNCSIPIATGERQFTRWGFKQLLSTGGADIVQPDVSHCGGISELKKIATMAEAYDVAVAPHCPLGPICLASSLQVDFCTPNAFIQEQSLGIHYNQGSDLLDYLVDPTVFHYADGFVDRPLKPGLGIEIDEAKVRAAATRGHRWRNPVWRTADGVVAEW